MSATTATPLDSTRTGTQETVAQTRKPIEATARLWDGNEIFYRAWLSEKPTTRALVLLRRGHEHSGRFQALVDRLDLRNVSIFAWDARGHGRSADRAGAGSRGSAPGFAHLVKDVGSFIQHLEQHRGLLSEETIVLGHSVGAVLAAAWVHDYAPRIRAMILTAPAFRVKLYVPFAIQGLRIIDKLKPDATVKSYVRPSMLTSDAEMQTSYVQDPLVTPEIPVDLLLGLHDASKRLVEDAGAIQTPTLLLTNDNDPVVDREIQNRFFERLGTSAKTLAEFRGLKHSILQDKERDLPIATLRNFIEHTFEAPRPTFRKDLLEADSRGPSFDRYQELEQELPALCPRKAGYASLRLGLATVGRMSEGIHEGWRTGFDSGESLDHVYGNQAKGSSSLGRVIDRIYLDGPGWRGIRQRKIHLERALDHCIADLTAEGRDVVLLDIASGPGRYVLDTIERHERTTGTPIIAICRDRDPSGLEAGRKLALERNIGTVRYLRGDAFDTESLARVTPRPSLAVVSGLYELFPSNEPVRRSLAGLGRAINQGGYLIYTNQPWHPQQELIARTLDNRDGHAWVMRCRSQPEMDELVREAGFEKVSTEIDSEGIFSVSIAIRR